MQDVFPLQQFRDAFEVTPKIKNKLQPFIAKFKEHNMQWIIKSFEQIHRMFYDDKVDGLLKFNSIFGIKFMFDTGEMILINLIQIYFLPRIFQIASYEVKGPDDKRGITYFVSIGYPKDLPEVEKFGYNFVRMASEFIHAAAAVKPRRLFEGEQINEPSDYLIADRKLQEAGWKPYAAPAYYKQGSAQGIRALFEKNLTEIDNFIDTYIDYYSRVFKQFIVEDRPFKGRLDPNRIIQYGDQFVATAILNLCEEHFASPSFKQKKASLSLMNELIKWGDIETAHFVNCTGFIDETVKQIVNPSVTSKALSRGKMLFKKNESSQLLKQQFYVEVLKDIQFWAVCYPKGIKIKNRDSKIKFIYDQLKNKFQLQFPEDKYFPQNKMIFDHQSQKHKKRNERLLKELKESDPQLQSIFQTSHSISSSKGEKQSIKKQKQPIKVEETPTGSDYDRIKKEIIEVNLCIDTLCDNQAKTDAKINKITSFTGNYESSIEQAALSNAQFDDIFNKADQLTERIIKITPHLDKYKTKKITFQQLTDIILNRKTVSPNKQSLGQQSNQSSIPKEPQKKPIDKNSEDGLIKIQQGGLQSAAPQRGNGNQKQTSTLSVNRFAPQQKPNTSNTLNVNPYAVQQKPHQAIKKIQDFTPIKKMHEQFQINQKFVQSQDLGSLPSISRQSFEKQPQPNYHKSLPHQKQEEQALNIQPASHVITDPKKITQSLFPQKVDPGKESAVRQQAKYMQPATPIKEVQSRSRIKNEHSGNQQLQYYDQNKGINMPKSLKNVAASYKLHNEVQKEQEILQKHVIGQPYQNILRESRESSKRGSKIKFDQSRISHISHPEMKQEDDNDIIMLPDTNPLEMSYHEFRGMDELLKQPNQLSFKKCFEEDNFLFGPDKQNKKFSLVTDTATLIKRSESSKKQSRVKESVISIPSILNERNKKFEEEIKYMEQKKNRKITELQSKIKVLQTNGEAMKGKIIQQDKQIKIMKANSEAESSRVKKASILEDQDIIFKAKLASVHNKSVKERSFYEESKRDPKYLEPIGKLINSRKYNAYFQQFQSEKQKKNLLKNKELLLKNEDIEFGCMSKRENNSLLVTFFITSAYDLDGLVCSVGPNLDSNLQIQLQPKNIPSIRKGKQQKINAIINIRNIPYYLPQIEFAYNIHHRLESQNFLIPCSFHKFVFLAPTDDRELSRHFDKSQRILRGEEVPYSKKLLKNLSSLTEYFPGGSMLKNGDPNVNGEIQFGGKGIWESEQFWIKVMAKPNQFLYVQVVGESENIVLEYYVSLVTNLLMKNIDLKQM